MLWIKHNLGNIIVIMMLVTMVGFIIKGMINDKKTGNYSCGGNCAHCSMCCKHKKLKSNN